MDYIIRMILQDFTSYLGTFNAEFIFLTGNTQLQDESMGNISLVCKKDLKCNFNH